MKLLVLLLAFTGTAIQVSAQLGPVSAIRPLSVGDIVPDIEFSHIVNYHSKTVRLSDFKGKLIILDFWATWCTSCLQHFPLLDSLQNEFAGKLQVLLIDAKNTGDSKEKITAFFERKKSGTNKRYQLPSVINDTLADKLFEHQLIPHYVWINGQGRVIAITSSDQVNAENILALTEGEEVQWSMKKDQNANRPLFSGNDLPEDSLMLYSIFLKGWFDGLPSGTRLRRTGEIVHGIALTNTCLFRMFEMAASSLIPGFTEKNMLLSIQDSFDLIPDTVHATRERWYKAHSFSYDLIVPVSQAGKLYSYLLEDLNRYSEYSGKIEQRRVRCFVLKKNNQAAENLFKSGPSENNLDEKEVAKYLHHQPISTLVNHLNAVLSAPVFDETDYTRPVDLQLPADLRDVPSLQNTLSKYGFTLEETNRELDMFVLTEKAVK